MDPTAGVGKTHVAPLALEPFPLEPISASSRTLCYSLLNIAPAVPTQVYIRKHCYHRNSQTLFGYYNANYLL